MTSGAHRLLSHLTCRPGGSGLGGAGSPGPGGICLSCAGLAQGLHQQGRRVADLRPHLEGTLRRRPGVLRLGLFLLLTVRLEQEVVSRVDDCGQGGAESWPPPHGVGLCETLKFMGSGGPVIGLAVLPRLGSLSSP